jgi:2-amino-4-hydroxy-6-hydroxymethyldihydropteridine diphosphokinase
MYQVYLGLGSNLGDRLQNLTRAVEAIGKIATIQSMSSLYETEPVGMEEASDFFNMVVSIMTPDDPPLLLVHLKTIERKLGRKHQSHGEPRLIDIDVVMYRGLAYEDPTIKVPHPQLEYRRFVLEPLHEIAPMAVHPTLGKTIAVLLRNCRDRHRVTQTEQTLNYHEMNEHL